MLNDQYGPWVHYGGAGPVAGGLRGVLYSGVVAGCRIQHPDREGVKAPSCATCKEVIKSNYNLHETS